MPRHHDSDSDSDSDYDPPRTPKHRHRSDADRGYWHGQFLTAPGAGGAPLHRSKSTGSRPQPQQVVIDVNARSSSHARSRSRRRDDYDSDSFDEAELRTHRRPRSRIHTPRGSSPYMDYETRKKMERLDLLERKEAEEEHERKIKEQIVVEKAKKEMEAIKRKKEEEEFKKRAIADWEREQMEKKIKEQKEKEEADRMFEERVKREFMAAGYSEQHIEVILKKKKKENMMAMDLSRPTYIKVNRKYLSPETLDTHQLPWEWDDRDSNFIIIKKWISQDYQEQLFEHTRKLREKRLLITDSSATITTTELHTSKDRDKMYLVRKKEKSPNRRGWLFT